MTQINDVYTVPVSHSSVGHGPLKILGNDAGPIELTPPVSEKRQSRRQARTIVKARKAEISSGAAFLRRLTTTSNDGS